MKYWKYLSEHDEQYLQDTFRRIEEYQHLIGYPCPQNKMFKNLENLLEIHINNCGDPFAGKTVNRCQTHDMEKEVIKFFADLYETKDSFWGYVTTGGTEGNIKGLLEGRENLRDPIVYFSDQSHYSVSKSAYLLNMPQKVIRSLDSGEIDCKDLYEKIQPERDCLLVLNVGTTMKGAIDNLVEVKKVFKKKNVKGVYIHADQALHGGYLPFIEGAPKINFSKGIDSLSISGHKFIGTPLPCGVFLTNRISKKIYVEYVGSEDNTITGSRSGLPPIFLWYALKSFGHKGLQALSQDTLKFTKEVVMKMNKKGIRCWNNPYSNIAVFNKLPEEITKKWQICYEGEISHIVCHPFSRKPIGEFLEDLDHLPSIESKKLS